MRDTISCIELKERLAKGAEVVDVMTPEDFAACHLAGAKNACIYEMVFLDRIAECIPRKETELVVYDATGTTLAAESAREKLQAAGYSNVSILKGGLSVWRAAGLPVDMGVEGESVELELQDGVYRLVKERSTLEWLGRNLNNRHYGRIAVQSGEIDIKAGAPVAGSIVLDMTSITNLDLEDPAWRGMLISHLKSMDFFGVERFPTASFQLTDWKPLEGGTPEAPTGTATGELTIRDVTRAIKFTAIVAPQMDGALKVHAAFDIDRTLWNVCYGSTRLYERLGMHLVHDIISLELFVLARRS